MPKKTAEMKEKVSRTRLTDSQEGILARLITIHGIRDVKSLMQESDDLSFPIGKSKAYALIEKYQIKDADKPADWGDLDKILKQGVNRDHIDALSTVSSWVETKFGEAIKGSPVPTLRNIKWQSYIMTIAPSITEPLDIWALAEILSARDMYWNYSETDIEKHYDIEGVIKATPNMAHLIAYLRYKPFDNDTNAKRYRDAVASNVIPKIKDETYDLFPDDFPLLKKFIRHRKNNPYFIRWASACMLWNAETSFPIDRTIVQDHFLPSENLVIHSKPLTIAFAEAPPTILGIRRGDQSLMITFTVDDIVDFEESYWHESESEEEGECQCVKCTDKEFWDK